MTAKKKPTLAQRSKDVVLTGGGIAGAFAAMLLGYTQFGGPVPATTIYVDQVAAVQQQQIRQLDARVLQAQSESLRRQLYGARGACAKKDARACDEARDLEKEIEAVRKDLERLQGR